MMTLTLVLALSTLAAALFAAFRSRPVDWGPLERPLEKMERALRDEIARSRAESALTQGQELATLRATVEDRLDEVHRGLGEMQSLAAGVGDLKKILSNVKLRGGWGEVQLGALLDQMLAPEQLARNWRPHAGSTEAVEFAVRLPGPNGCDGEEVMLPIDAKLPVEDWLRLVQAAEAGDRAGAEQAAHRLEIRIRQCAREIAEKYVVPPRTTDFAIMFLPTEGLFAEVIRRPQLVEQLQRELRVMVAGPTTLAALLSSLQMGFRTLAVQRRSSEVWALLGSVKSEFGRFGHVLEGVRHRLEQATQSIDKAAQRSRVIERKLRSVEELPASDDALVLDENDEAGVM